MKKVGRSLLIGFTVATVLLLMLAVLGSGYVNRKNAVKFARMRALGRTLEMFARSHGRMPDSWAELVGDPMVRQLDHDVIGFAGQRWRVRRGEFAIVFGVRKDDPRLTDDGALVNADGSRARLLETKGISWPFDRHEWLSKKISREIRDAMNAGPPRSPVP